VITSERQLQPAMPRVFAIGRRYVHNLSTDARAGLFGLGWSYLTHALQLVLRLGSSLILTRLLLPEAYGVFGPALAVVFLLDLLTDVGIQPAVVRSPHGDSPEFLGTARTFIMIRAIPLSLAVFALAWVLPQWYGLAELQSVLIVLSVRPVLIALFNPSLLTLYRQLNYRIPFYVDILHTSIAVPITIFLSWQLRNVWALVLGLLIGDVIRVILTYLLCPPAPRFRWHRPTVDELFRFGSGVFFNTLAFGAWVYFDRLAGPRLLPPEEMGLYILAWSLAESMEVLISRGGDVFYSMLARLDPGAARAAFVRRTARRAALYLILGLVLGAIVAPWMFQLIYPARFHGAAVLFGLLTARLILRATTHVQFMYLMMRNEIFIATRSYVFSFILLAATFIVWVRYLELGVMGVALSSVIAMSTFTVAQTTQMVRRGQMSPWPAVVALGWTTFAVASVLSIYK
jgi:O-antigen/teichoic acid export membrane protein